MVYDYDLEMHWPSSDILIIILMWGLEHKTLKWM